MSCVKCEGLSVSFGGTRALDGVSVEFRSAKVTAIIGPNGAGKTTLLNAMTGYVRPDSGRVLLDSISVTGLRPHQIAKRGIGRTFQEVRIIDRLSALDNVLLAYPNYVAESFLSALYCVGRETESNNRSDAMNVLQQVGLGRVSEEPAGTLSYGQQRLLGIACCIALTPQILLLDEPVAGLHPPIAEAVLDVLRHLRQEGRTVVVTEHDISAVRALADDVVVMAGGRIFTLGTADEVFARRNLLGVYFG